MRAKRMINALNSANSMLASWISPGGNSLHPSTDQLSSNEPCARVSQVFRSYMAQNPKAKVARIQPSLAVACLKSIPVDTDNNLALLDYLEPYLLFQSTLEILRDPPEGYLVPGVDLLGGIGQIRAKLYQGQYEGQWQVLRELERVFFQGYDFHLKYLSAINRVFTFHRDCPPLVSVSEDGLELPRVFFERDTKAVNYEPSEIVAIDGVHVVEHLERIGNNFFLHDPDAQYNYLFNSVLHQASRRGNLWLGHPGNYEELLDVTSTHFANGSTGECQNFALTVVNFTHINSANRFHQALELPFAIDVNVDSSRGRSSIDNLHDYLGSEAHVEEKSFEGFPEAVQVNKYDLNRGHFINHRDYWEVAVLSIPTFLPPRLRQDRLNVSTVLPETRRSILDFMQDCRDANKTKLIIDLSGNGGGLVAIPFEIHRLLFPNSKLWDGSRMRAWDGLDTLGNIHFTNKSATFMSLHAILDEEGLPFRTWEDMYGPVEVAGQNVTNMMRWNRTAVSEGEPITGDQGHVYPPGFKPERYFSPEDIVVMTDGFCGSACIFLVNLLVREQGVKSVALGGRPMYTPMQIMGGSKGSQLLQSPHIDRMLKVTAAKNLSSKNKDMFEDALQNGRLPRPIPAPLQPSLARAALSVNWRNSYRAHDRTGYPTQFQYEAAHCRLFYTAAMINDVEDIWRRVADVGFYGGKCVNGSTSNPDGTISDTPLLYSDKVRSRAMEYVGPGSLKYRGDYAGWGSIPNLYSMARKRGHLVEEIAALPDENFDADDPGLILGGDYNI